MLIPKSLHSITIQFSQSYKSGQEKVKCNKIINYYICSVIDVFTCARREGVIHHGGKFFSNLASLPQAVAGDYVLLEGRI